MNSTYGPEFLPTTSEIHDTVADEIASLGGTVSDVLEEGHRVFMRAVFPMDAEVRPGDSVRGGIAVRATSAEILVHPYTYRQVCTNGAIAAHTLQSRRLERIQSTEVFLPTFDIALTLTALRDTIRECAAPEVFATVTNEMRSAADVEADFAIHLLPALARMSGRMSAHLLPRILERLESAGDRSVFGLMNAVTSIARDTPDPETRWSLEELGGTMPARLVRQPHKDSRTSRTPQFAM